MKKNKKNYHGKCEKIDESYLRPTRQPICLNKGMNQTVTANVHITLARMLRLLHNPITTQLATPFNKSKYYMNTVSPRVQDTPFSNNIISKKIMSKIN